MKNSYVCPQQTQYLTEAWDEIGAGDTFFHTLVCRNMKVWRLVFFYLDRHEAYAKVCFGPGIDL